MVEVGHFWGYRTDEKNTAVLRALSAEIDYQNLVDLAVPPCVDVLCLAPFTYLGKRGYYRAHILYIHGDLAEVMCCVILSWQHVIGLTILELCCLFFYLFFLQITLDRIHEFVSFPEHRNL